MKNKNTNSRTEEKEQCRIRLGSRRDVNHVNMILKTIEEELNFKFMNVKIMGSTFYGFSIITEKQEREITEVIISCG